MIMKLARWGSCVVLRYLGDSPLRALTATYFRSRKALSRRAANAVSHNVHGSEHVSHAQTCLDETVADEESDIAFVQHRQTKKIHIISSAKAEFLGLGDRQTLCFWQAALPNVTITEARPSGELCKDCRKSAQRLGLAVQSTRFGGCQNVWPPAR